MFDERFTALRGYGSAVNLTAWYESATTIKHMTFAGGSTEELLFIDEHNHARLFSLITGQFRSVPGIPPLATDLLNESFNTDPHHCSCLKPRSQFSRLPTIHASSPSPRMMGSGTHEHTIGPTSDPRTVWSWTLRSSPGGQRQCTA
jgi:hypothetical protein